jgi:nucleoside-diphosphate-sugar epimerase
MSRILVTGGAGFIGYNFSKFAVSQGHEITVLDSLVGSSINKDEIVQAGMKFIHHDIRDLDSLTNVDGQFDTIIHLAAQTSVQYSILHPEETREINVQGTSAVVRFANRFNIRRIIAASSSAVYGDSKEQIHQIGCEGNQISPYAITKFENETQVLEFRKEGFEGLALRFFNVFGPGQTSTGAYAAVIPTFIEKISHDSPCTIFGDGLQTRDFIFVQDVIELLLKLATVNALNPKNHVYNVGTGLGIAVKDIGSMISELLGHSEFNFITQPQREGDVIHSIADTSETESDLDWKPRFSIRQGLERLVGR